MFKKSRYVVGLVVIVISVTIGCVINLDYRHTSYDYPDSMPVDFNFISNIESNSYILDTYKNKLTKAIDSKVDTIISYQLSLDEKQKIYEVLKDIDIYKYPENYAPTSTITVSPSFAFQFEFTLNGSNHKIIWTENTESETKDARDLRKLFNAIQRILLTDDRIKKLPESKRVFL